MRSSSFGSGDESAADAMSEREGGYAIVVAETDQKKLKLYGCTAEKRDVLEEADEISEVNGRMLDNWILTDIADFLKRCIHSRTLCLRIRPKSSQEKVGNVIVRETFLISVNCGQPTDEHMTRLSLQPQAIQDRQTSTVTPLLENSFPKSNQSSNSEVPVKEVAHEIKEIVTTPHTTREDPPSSIQSSVEDAMKNPKTIGNNNNSLGFVEQQAVHREMAVDVPESFIAVTKTTPRYPPPRKKPPNAPETSSLKKNDGNGNVTEEKRTPPTPRISELIRTEETLKSEEEKLMDFGQMQRIRKYQNELRKRKEDEERHTKENDFLRSSLRGSCKLQALEKLKSGEDNSGFHFEENYGPSLQEKMKMMLTPPIGELKMHDSPAVLEMLCNIKAVLAKSGIKESVDQLEKLLKNQEFQVLLNLSNKVQAVACFNCLPTPICTDAEIIFLEAIRTVQSIPSNDAKELLHILRKFENLMICHDKIALRQTTSDISEEEELLSKLSQYTEESIKIIRIEKTTEPLGATVKNDGEAVIIGRIVKGGIAEKSGLLHEGDEILEVNGMELRGRSVNDVCDIMADMCGTLTFLIIPNQYSSPKHQTRENVIHLKAHFDYEPDDDLYIPCKELGMSFQKGDVLHIISQDDPNWWQAYREGEEDQLLAGLIPSKSFQQQREIMKQAVIGDVKERKAKKGKFLCARRPHRRKKKKLYNLNYNDDTDSDQVLTYEEVRLYYPRANQKRPLVLIGPQKVGRHELRQRLMEDTSRFAAAVPHTSRTKKDSEVNGVDYFFISRTQFEADILAGHFVEHGEYQRSYYGTSLDAIRKVIEASKTCILNLHPQSLKILKKSDLMPYIVFIAPPSLEKLRQNCLKMDNSVKDEELKDIIEKAREMEEFYGHYFDLVLINMDLEKTYNELLHEISVIEREPQWVPASWINDDPT